MLALEPSSSAPVSPLLLAEGDILAAASVGPGGGLSARSHLEPRAAALPTEQEWGACSPCSGGPCRFHHWHCSCRPGGNTGVHCAHGPLSPLLACLLPRRPPQACCAGLEQIQLADAAPHTPMCGVSHLSQFIPITGPPGHTLVRTHDTYPPGLMCSLPRMPLPWRTGWCPSGVLALAPRSPLLGVSCGPDVPCTCAGGGRQASCL